jgi:preprotein translocase subunit SecA
MRAAAAAPPSPAEVDAPIGDQPGALASAPEADEEIVNEPVRVEKTPGRNEPCYCGSGKKYKLCHGR